MACKDCSLRRQLAGVNSDSLLCTNCEQANMTGESVKIKNDVVYYIYRNGMRSTGDAMSKGCELKYVPDEIEKARNYFLNMVREKLIAADGDLVEEVEKSRRGGKRRTKSIAMITDIENMLKAMGTEITVSPVDISNVPILNPESMLPEAVIARIIEVEKMLESYGNDIKMLKQENIALKNNKCCKLAPPHSTPSENAAAAAAAAADAAAVAGTTAAAVAANDDVSNTDTDSTDAKISSVADADDDADTDADAATVSAAAAAASALAAATASAAAAAAAAVTPATPNSSETVNVPEVENITSIGTSVTVTDDIGSVGAPKSLPESHNSSNTVLGNSGKAQAKPKTNMSRAGPSMTHKRNIACQELAANTAAQAAANGMPVDKAIELGKSTAAQFAKSYSEVTKKVAVGKIQKQDVASQRSPVPPTAPSTNHDRQPRDNGEWTIVGRKNKSKKHLPKYTKGTGNVSAEASIARPKPAYLENKVLVVSGMNVDITKDEIITKITSRAKQELDQDVAIQHIVRLDRDGSWYATAAIELNENDYNILANPDFWEAGIGIRDWVGPRFWRGGRRLKPQDIRSSPRRVFS